MSELVVFTYKEENKASDVLQTIGKLKKEFTQKPLINIEDAAMGIKTKEGQIKIRQTLESVAKGTNVAYSGMWGVLAGFLFGGPLLGLLEGAGIGVLLGRKIDIGIDNTFIQNVSENLLPGDSALFLLVRDTPTDVLVETLNTQGGRLFHTSLPDEVATAFTQASEYEDVKRALELENVSPSNKS
jgi:uncharacterized membrane protein